MHLTIADNHNAAKFSAPLKPIQRGAKIRQQQSLINRIRASQHNLGGKFIHLSQLRAQCLNRLVAACLSPIKALTGRMIR